MSCRIYVASSWRNQYQPAVVQILRAGGLEVYDFRNPEPGGDGFHWSEIDPDWQAWTTAEYVEALNHPVAVDGYGSDFRAMDWADTFVLVLPSGRSSHLELGWAVGAGKQTAIYVPESIEPELMYKMADLVTDSQMELLDWLGVDD